MRILPLILIVYVAAVIQTSLADVASIGHVQPDLLALVAMTWMLVAPGPRAFLAAGGIGLLSDLAAAGRPGMGPLCFLLVGYAAGRLRTRLALDHLPAQVLTVWAAVTLMNVGQAVGHWLLGEVPLSLPVVLGRAVGVGLYTAGASLPVLMVIGWLREPRLARERKLNEF